MQLRRVFSLFLLAVAAILLLYYRPFLTGKACFYIFDLYAGWHPFLHYIGQRLHAGQLPMWNPYLLSGFPQIADPAPTAFYPFYLLFGWLSFSRALAVTLAGQQLLSAAGAFLLVSSFGWGALAALTAGICFALGGFMFSLQPTPTLMGTAAWLVIDWWSLRLMDARSPSSMLALSACTAVITYLAVAAGVAEIYCVGLLMLVLWAITDCLRQQGVRRRRARLLLLLRFMAIGLGVMLAAIIVLPASEWAALSPRAAGLPLYEIFAWSANWYDYLCIAVPQPLGDLYDPFNVFRPLVAEAPNETPYLSSIFLGPIALTLAVVGALDKRFAARFVVLFLLLVSAVIAAGSNVLPVVYLVYALKLRTFRYPIKAFTFVFFFLCLLAARGMKQLREATSGTIGGALLLAASAWSLLLIGAIVAHHIGTGSIALAQAPHLTRLQLKMILACADATIWTAIGGVVSAVFCLVVAFQRRAVFRNIACFFLLAVCTVLFIKDAFIFNYHPAPADFYRKPVFVAQIINRLVKPEGSLRRTAVLYQTPPLPEAAITASNPVIAVYQYTRQMLSPDTSMDHDIDNVLDYSVGQTADHNFLWQHAMQQFTEKQKDAALATMCRISSVPVVTAQLSTINLKTKATKPLPQPSKQFFTLALEDKRMNLGVYYVKDPLPRAYFAPAIKWGKPHAAVRAFIAGSAESGFDPGKLVILEHNSDKEVGPSLKVTETQLKAARAGWLADRPEELRLEVTTPVDNFLVLTDQFYPGWQAYVDGKPVPIYRANVLFRAVLVPAGSHLVEFVFRPGSFGVGLLLHLFAWLLIACLLWLAYKVRARDRLPAMV